MESNASVVVPEEIVRAPSPPFQPTIHISLETDTFLLLPLASLSDIARKSPHTGAAFSVSQAMSTVGVTAIGLPAPSKPITWVVVPVRYVSTPLPSVMIALFAVNPVLVPQAMLSLVLDRVLIELVFPAMRPESVSSADLIAPEIDPRVNI